MKEIKWSKKSEKMLDEIFEGKEEISLYDKAPTEEESCRSLFERFCFLTDTLLEKEKLKDKILIILRDNERWYKLEEFDLEGIDSDKLKNLLKDKDMIGYITLFNTNKIDRNKNFVCKSLIRTLYTPKIFIKNVIDFEGEAPKQRIINGRENLFDSFDFWCKVEIENIRGE